MKTKTRRDPVLASKTVRRVPRGRQPKAHKPIWQEVLNIFQGVPQGDLHKLPTDLDANHDHYLYGSHRS
jgi:hypothetical protein